MNVSMACKTNDCLCANLPGLHITTSPSNVPLYAFLLQLCNRGIEAIRNVQGNRTCSMANMSMPSIQCWRPRSSATMQSRRTR